MGIQWKKKWTDAWGPLLQATARRAIKTQGMPSRRARGADQVNAIEFFFFFPAHVGGELAAVQPEASALYVAPRTVPPQQRLR